MCFDNQAFIKAPQECYPSPFIENMQSSLGEVLTSVTTRNKFWIQSSKVGIQPKQSLRPYSEKSCEPQPCPECKLSLMDLIARWKGKIAYVCLSNSLEEGP